jgi:hypothetical protein
MNLGCRYQEFENWDNRGYPKVASRAAFSFEVIRRLMEGFSG